MIPRFDERSRSLDLKLVARIHNVNAAFLKSDSTSSPLQARAGMDPSMLPWSAKAFKVSSRMVFTVNGAAREWT
jgi:hypothetical protein